MFDLLLDLIIKKESFKSSIFCIDEPELHISTKIQSKIMQVLFDLIPVHHSQLWIATHSLGMVRQAMEIYKKDPEAIVFIDFQDSNFDEYVNLSPCVPNRDFWKRTYDIVLDDLSHLIAPGKVIFCEGGSAESKEPPFDQTVYSTIFSKEYPDVDFISLGGSNDVIKQRIVVMKTLERLIPGVNCTVVCDRDDSSSGDIENFTKNGIRVLKRREIENYLWDDEILKKLAQENNGDVAKAEKIIQVRDQLIPDLEKGDIKSIAGQLYNDCKKEMTLTSSGKNHQSFARDVLAPLVTSETNVYKELKSIIFND